MRNRRSASGGIIRKVLTSISDGGLLSYIIVKDISPDNEIPHSTKRLHNTKRLSYGIIKQARSRPYLCSLNNGDYTARIHVQKVHAHEIRP